MSTLTTGVSVEAGALSTGISETQFAELVERHQRRIYRLLLHLTRSADTAETLTQDCFLRAYQKRESFRGEANVTTWLTRIALNLAHDWGRSKRQKFWRQLFAKDRDDAGEETESPLEKAADVRLTPEASLLNQETAALMWQSVDGLTEQQRTVFLLRFMEEMSMQQIADATGLGVSTVKTHLRRSVQKLQQDLARRGLR